MARQAFVVALFLSLTVTVWSQEGWVYPPTEVTASDAESLEEARRSVNLHDYKVALEIYLRLAEENRGTAHGAACLESARSVYFLKGDRAAAESVRQRIITEYSGSRFEVYARYNALQSSPSSGPEDSLLAYSDFLQEFGAPRLEGLCTGETIEQATLQVRSLHPEIRFGIASVYSAAFCIPEDNQQALNIARFGRMAFHSPCFVNIDFGGALE